MSISSSNINIYDTNTTANTNNNSSFIASSLINTKNYMPNSFTNSMNNRDIAALANIRKDKVKASNTRLGALIVNSTTNKLLGDQKYPNYSTSNELIQDGFNPNPNHNNYNYNSNNNNNNHNYPISSSNLSSANYMPTSTSNNNNNGIMASSHNNNAILNNSKLSSYTNTSQTIDYTSRSNIDEERGGGGGRGLTQQQYQLFNYKSQGNAIDNMSLARFNNNSLSSSNYNIKDAPLSLKPYPGQYNSSYQSQYPAYNPPPITGRDYSSNQKQQQCLNGSNNSSTTNSSININNSIFQNQQQPYNLQQRNYSFNNSNANKATFSTQNHINNIFSISSSSKRMKYEQEKQSQNAGAENANLKLNTPRQTPNYSNKHASVNNSNTNTSIPYPQTTTTNNNNKYNDNTGGGGISQEPRGLLGLRNIGNTCYMNSILQCFFNSPEFTRYFIKKMHKKELNPKNKGLATVFGNLMEKIHKYSGKSSYYNAESPIEFKNTIEHIYPLFSGYDQHDAQEFLKALLEGLNDDLNRNHQKQPYKELTVDEKKSIQAVSDEWFKYNLGRDHSIITDLFCGQLLNKVICIKCNNESLSFDNYWDLSLSFTRGLSILESCDVSRMLEHFLKEELLDDSFHCEKCKTKRNTKKKFIIWKIPQILVIHLKRFYYGRYKKEKITQNITFPIKGLDLKPFLNETSDPSARNCIYDLFAIVNHDGNLNGGHYTAYMIISYKLCNDHS